MVKLDSVSLSIMNIMDLMFSLISIVLYFEIEYCEVFDK